MTKHEIREVFIHSIAEQYKNHGERVPSWLHIGDIEFEVEEQEPFVNKSCVSSEVCEHDKQKVLDKIRAEITDCLKALDEIEKSGLNIYLPNEISGRRLTYKQCLGFIDKYKAESEGKE